MATSRQAYNRAYWRANTEKLKGYARAYRDAHVAADLWRKARDRAARLGVSFELAESDIVVPEFCPALGLKLERCSPHACDSSPTLDRLQPDEGYTPSNVRVISHLANRIKSNIPLEQLEAVARWMRTELEKSTA